eukprot:5604823-Amphidinium_carterae.1
MSPCVTIIFSLSGWPFVHISEHHFATLYNHYACTEVSGQADSVKKKGGNTLITLPANPSGANTGRMNQ